MCEYCGCRGVEPIAELMDEHSALADEAHEIRKAIDDGDPDRTLALITHLAGHLARHTGREEAGLFTALRDKDEFLHELGVFPVSVVSLGVDGWEVVERSRTESPSFLLDQRTRKHGDDHNAARVPDSTDVASPRHRAHSLQRP